MKISIEYIVIVVVVPTDTRLNIKGRVHRTTNFTRKDIEVVVS